ncbi:MAG: helix-turn-helix domain-containing protein [Opitutaceae bacterium]
MVTNKIKLLETTKAKVAQLEKSIAAQLSKELAALPRKYGYKSYGDFLDAVRAVAGKGLVAAGKKVGTKRRKRAIITAETKAKVKELAQAGKTGGEIARAVGISLPSVQNIKKELGLVKKRR